MDSFFLSPGDGVDFISGTYNWGLVMLSVLVPICLSMMALHTAGIALQTQNKIYKHIAIGLGGISLGGGIWAMHFIGMMAFILPVPVSYDITITVISLFPGWAAAWLTMYMLARKTLSKRMLFGSALLMGSGVGAMHYIGMEAMVTPLVMYYEPVMFSLSIVVAVLLAMLAIWIHFGLYQTRLKLCSHFVLASLVMGCAISGMHYTGMAAVRFLGKPSYVINSFWIDSSYIALALACLAIAIGVMVAAINGMMHTRQLMREIDEGKSRLQAILDTAVDAIITIDGFGKVMQFSKSAEKLFGYTADEVVGQNIKMLMPDPFHSEHDSYLKNYRDTGITNIIGIGREVVGRRKNGSTMPIRLAVGRVNTSDDSMLFVGMIADISEFKQLEASLRDTAKRAHAAAAAKTSFLANMSHEIRTPMNSITGFTDLLLQTEVNQNQRTYLNNIKQSSRSLLRLINDILDATKVESGQLEFEICDFSLKSLAMQIESSLRLGAISRNLYLHTHYPDSMPEFFKGDRLRLLQIFTNLVGNAIKFTESGGVNINFDYQDNQIHVQIQDTGIGMLPEQIESIFEPFTQADASISRRFGGTGLGTTISLQLVQSMGGQIKVDSELGKGSVFHVWLPLPLGQLPINPGQAVAQINLPQLNVLIADDVAQNLELLQLTLENHGHTVIAASDGQEAFTAYRNASFDLILMDVHMPNVDGLQATRMIRAYEKENCTGHIPIIALTASVMTHDRQEASLAGMDGFAAKPLDVPSLFREMAVVLALDAQSESKRKSSEPATVTPVGNYLINWSVGQSLWGSRAKLVQQIRLFLVDVTSKYPVFDLQNLPDSDKCRMYLHGLRGVAGNLGLSRLSDLVATLEDQLVHDGKMPQTAQIKQLSGLLEQLKQAISVESETTAQPAGYDEHTPPITDAQVQQAFVSLSQAIQKNQLDDDSLAIVCTAMQENGHVQKLCAALNDFDFDEAHEILGQLRAEKFDD